MENEMEGMNASGKIETDPLSRRGRLDDLSLLHIKAATDDLQEHREVLERATAMA